MPARVSLFVTCIVDQLFPKVGIAVADVLERLGYRVDFPERQTCCGQPAFNSGYREEARQVARHFLDVFGDADYIVVPSGSCTSMIAHHFEDIFEKELDSLARARLLAPKVYEFSRFLIEIAGVDDVGARLDEVVTYHTTELPCIARTENQGRAAPPAGLRARARVARNGCRRGMLRFRRNIFREIR